MDLVAVSSAQGGWRDAASALATVEQAKRDKHTQTCGRHRFDFLPFGFSVFDSFGLVAISHSCLCRLVGGSCLDPRSPFLRSHARGGRPVCRSSFSFFWLVIQACFLACCCYHSFGHDALALDVLGILFYLTTTSFMLLVQLIRFVKSNEGHIYNHLGMCAYE